MTHLLFELARHPEIQNRLAKEITDVVGDEPDPNSDEYFDKVMNGIPYLEAVIKEGLRRYPPLGAQVRLCGTDGYELMDGVTLYKGQMITIPIVAVHLDPEYYPDPLR